MKRTPLTRKTPMPRATKPLARVPLPRQPSEPTSKPKPRKPDPDAAGTPLPLKLRRMAIERATCPVTGAVLCDWCGLPIFGQYSVHHRLPGRLGGRRGKHTPASIVVVHGSGTTRCHGEIESNRTEALRRNFLIPDGAAVPPPEETPLLRHGRHWVIPGDGCWIDADEPQAA